MNEEMELVDITIKLSGIILKKAEMENNFEAVYSKVFDRMSHLTEFGDDGFLVLLGDIGG